VLSLARFSFPNSCPRWSCTRCGGDDEMNNLQEINAVAVDYGMREFQEGYRNMGKRPIETMEAGKIIKEQLQKKLK
jgi:hypothetical protein